MRRPEDDFWTLNGARAFGHIPGDRFGFPQRAVPICLQRGTLLWGSDHISKKHGHFIDMHSVGAADGCRVPWVVWKKLQQPGMIWSAEESDKFKLALTLSPNALLVVKLKQQQTVDNVEASEPVECDDDQNQAPASELAIVRTHYFGIITLYANPRSGASDGQQIERYVGQKWQGPPPAFVLPSLPSNSQKPQPVQITIKRKRNISIPPT